MIVQVVLYLPLTLALVVTCIRSFAMILRGTNHVYALLDDESHSQLYCQSDLLNLAEAGPRHVAGEGIFANSPSVACIPPRTDKFAPGRGPGTGLDTACAFARSLPFTVIDQTHRAAPCDFH